MSFPGTKKPILILKEVEWQSWMNWYTKFLYKFAELFLSIYILLVFMQELGDRLYISHIGQELILAVKMNCLS